LSSRLLAYTTPVAAWLVLTAWLYRDCLRKVEAERAALRAEGEAILVALESGIRAMSRGRFGRRGHRRSPFDMLARDLTAERDALREKGEPVSSELESKIQTLSTIRLGRAEQLGASLEELVQNPSILGAAIVEKDGRAIVSAGDVDRWGRAVDAAAGEQWLDGALLLTRAVDVGRDAAVIREMQSLLSGRKGRRFGEGGFGGGPPWMSPRGLPPPPGPSSHDGSVGPLYARLVMCEGELGAMVKHHVTMACAAATVGLVAAVVLALAWHVSIKNREQSAALEVAEAHNQHLREMQLAGAGLAHEIKNPLNVLRGTAQGLLENGGRPASEHEAVERMLDEIDRVVSRLNEFLTFSKIPTPKLAPVHTTQIVEEVAELLEQGVDHGDRRLQFGELPWVKADPGLLRQLLFNLMHNAIRATEESGRVHIRACPNGSSGTTIEVADTGVGVAEGVRDQLFRPYCSGWEGGTGLGLSIVRQLAAAHGWRVGYRPNKDGGSTFWVASIEAIHNRDDDEATQT